ncbi:hypothetical protein BJY04DRAFT_214201 [Aspergillus karnatakaensis]|uniref:SGNH/GDSL hydrolase family protein n=1 Tax=Aspergillus karnatakaensis TaxID=1810916 RepID=UPI003CCD0F03
MKPQSALGLLASPYLSLFSFGDSYSSTGFNVSSTQPSLQNPMGNPRLGDGTAADSINWIGYLTTVYNDTPILSYNHAVFGATVDNKIVPGEPWDLASQIEQTFKPHYCLDSSLQSERQSRFQPHSQSQSHWTSDAALFAIWVGINDIDQIYTLPDYPAFIDRDIQRYFNLIDTLYACGARDFLFINVPPVNRTPKVLNFPPEEQILYAETIDAYNRKLLIALVDWQTHQTDVTVRGYDAWTFMTNVLDRPREYGFFSGTCMGEGCVWWDDYHPRSAFHELLAEDVALLLRE